MEVDSQSRANYYGSAKQRDTEMANIAEYEETKTNQNGFFNDTKSAAACSVRVAVRVRPLVGRELFESPNICIKCFDKDNQLVIGKDRAFTFDKVFDIGTKQQDVFDVCVKNLVLGCFQGYNATVLAYGQTGSGKTFTMGSGYTIGIKEHDLGIIPRVIKLIFDEVEKRRHKADIVIKCAFLEIYNEELHDLLDHQSSLGNGSGGGAGVIDRFIQKKEISIREEKNGSISLFGLREDKVTSYEELAACLDKGSNFRSTASTLMNNCSSRSHAIFTITIEQSIIEDLYKPDGANGGGSNPAPGDSPEEYMVAKFHFVDLAGSERAKRTGATGNTLKEGISINKGLLALGNVIAALTEEGKKNHVPYRDSKLTRILQDSLGGNSRTSMIACVSPAEVNFEETLNSLKYASRARNIKNAPKVNRDPNSAQIAQLRQQVFDLQRELQGCKKILISNNLNFDLASFESIPGDLNPPASINVRESFGGRPSDSMYGAQQIQRLEAELKDIKEQKTAKEKKVLQLQTQIDTLNDQNAQSQIEFFEVKKERDQLRFNLEQLMVQLKKRQIYEEIIMELNGNGQGLDLLAGAGDGFGILEEYQVKVEEQKRELNEKNQVIKTLQKDNQVLVESAHNDLKNLEAREQEIERLKRSVNKLQKENVQIKNEQRRGSNQTPGINSGSGSAVGNVNKSVMPSVLRKSNDRKSLAEQVKQKGVVNQQPLQDASNNQWISRELDQNIQHFNELFIENLSQSLSAMLVKKPPPSTNQVPDKVAQDDPMHQAITEEQKGESSDSDHLEDEQMAEDFDDQIQIPKDECEQQAVIESNEEVKQEDQIQRANLMQQEQLIESLEDNLKDKESLLQAIKQSHKALSSNLLEAMKNEYHKKIAAFQQEMLQLEQERAEQIRKADSVQQKSKLEEVYKRKLKDLEDKLSLAKQKEREQQAMQKQSSTQKVKIKTLESEIERMKTQKVVLMKQMKEESEKHRKWKADRVKELMQMKSQNLKKDREIQMLKRENKKKEQIAKRRQEELSAFMKKSKSDKQKQINGQKERNKKKNIDVEYLQNWIIQNTEKMLRYKELQSQMILEKTQQKEVEDQIKEEQGQFAQLSVRREKLEFRKGQLESYDLNEVEDQQTEEELYHINEELENLNFEMRAVQDNLDNLEEKNDFIENKITTLKTAVIEFNPDDVDELKFEEVQSIEGARACLGAFFGILLDVNVYKRQLEQQNIQNETTIETLNSQLEELKAIQLANEINFQKQLELINQEYMEKEELLVKVIMDNGGSDIDQAALQSLIQLNPKLVSSKQPDEQVANKGQKKTTVSTAKKLEIQNNNHLLYNQSKTALSKRVAELERERKEEQKKFEAVKHKLEQTNGEKELIKRQLDTIRLKIKQQDIMDVKQSKISVPSAAGGYDDQQNQLNTMSGQKSPRVNMAAVGNAQIQKMQTLKDVRNERKLKKMVVNTSSKQQQAQEPRVIVDEPMEDDDYEYRSVESSRERRPNSSIDIVHGQNSTKNADAPSNVFARLNQPGKSRGTFGSFVENNTSSLIQQQQQQNPYTFETFEDDQNWKCIINKEQAHSGQICAVASVGNQLYSTSNKSLRIWDLEGMQVVSDIAAHSGFIRCFNAWEDRKLLLTASDKTIILWDMISLTQVAQLKGHKEEIRALAVAGGSGGLLFSAGKGSQNGGSLLIWDLRKGVQPIEEKEKNQDVFCLSLQQDYLYMGCRNHYVYPINLKTFETHQPFEPPHFDAVTSLAFMQDDALISGSRDKNLRCWDTSTFSSLNTCSAVMSAHSDWINTLEAAHDRKFMYSGCRDGVVKVWKMTKGNRQLKCTAQLSLNSGVSQPSGGSGSINTISKIDKQFGVMFATGGSDKQIRIWKYTENSNVHEEGRQSNFDQYLVEGGDGQPDYEMIDGDINHDEDDFFEFDDNNAVPKSVEKMRPQHSAKLAEETKQNQMIGHRVRSYSRGNGGQSIMGEGVAHHPQTTPNLPFTVSAATSKLENKRREKRLQDQLRRNFTSISKENGQ